MTKEKGDRCQRSPRKFDTQDHSTCIEVRQARSAHGENTHTAPSLTVLDIVGRVCISNVAEALGVKLDRTRRRCVATWREGKNFSVSLDDDKGVYHDFVSNEGGGVLAFVARVRGCDRKTALRWLADFTRAPLDDQPLSPKDRKRWARERAETERIRVEAVYFQDAARLMAEWALEDLSSTDPKRAAHTLLLAALRVSPEAEYRAWLKHQPKLAAALVHAGRRRARRLQTALAHHLLLEARNAA